MTDILLCQTNDDGDIEVINGTMTMTNSFESAVYQSLWGGNEDDPGDADTSREWWGNTLATADGERERSRTQHILRSLPQTGPNMVRLKQAVESDLAWMVVSEMFSSYEVFVSVPRLNWVYIRIDSVDGIYQFQAPWGATS